MPGRSIWKSRLAGTLLSGLPVASHLGRHTASRPFPPESSVCAALHLYCFLSPPGDTWHAFVLRITMRKGLFRRHDSQPLRSESDSDPTAAGHIPVPPCLQGLVPMKLFSRWMRCDVVALLLGSCVSCKHQLILTSEDNISPGVKLEFESKQKFFGQSLT